MVAERCPDDVRDPSCRAVAAAVAHEIEGSSFTQSYRLDAILRPLLRQAIIIRSAYLAPIRLHDGRINPRLYLALYDVAEYVIYHIIYSGEKRVDKNKIYFMMNAKHRVNAVRLSPESCDLLSYGKIEAEEDRKIEDVIFTHWLVGQAFNRPVICGNQLCNPTATYLRIYDEHTGTFRTYSMAIVNVVPHIIEKDVEPPLLLQHLLSYRRNLFHKAYVKLITYDPATGKLQPHTLQLFYINICYYYIAVPGPHLLLYGPALGNIIIGAPLGCTCPGAEDRYCSRTMYYHISLLVLALLTSIEENPRTMYTKLARKAYRIMEPGESRHLSYTAIINELIDKLGPNYKLLGATLAELSKNPRTPRRPLRKGEKLLKKQLDGKCKIVL